MAIRHTILVLLLPFLQLNSFATHLIGGEITYQYVGKTMNDSVRFKVQVHLLRDCLNSEVPFDSKISIGVYQKDDLKLFSVHSTTLSETKAAEMPCDYKYFSENTCIESGKYEFFINLPATNQEFILSYKRCCRGLSRNLPPSSGASEQGMELRSTIHTAYQNSTPQSSYLGVICSNNLTLWNIETSDINGDSIVYTSVNPSEYVGASLSNTLPNPTSTLEQLVDVQYNAGYGFNFPFGTSSTFTNKNNIVSILATGNTGLYDLAFLVEEYRDDLLISSRNIEIAVSVLACPDNDSLNHPTSLRSSAFRHWQTQLRWNNCQNNVDKYEVFRIRQDETSFSSLGYTPGPHLNFIDSTITSSGLYFYYVEGITQSPYKSSTSNIDSISWWPLSTLPAEFSKPILYPNPSTGILHIKSDAQILSVHLIDIFGREILIDQRSKGNVTIINLENLSNGIYRIRIVTPNGNWIRPITKI